MPPDYVPYTDVKPDLPGTADGVPPGYFTFPAPPVQRPGFPLPKTDPVTGLLQGSPPAIAPDNNPAYEAFRASAGNTMNATTIPGANYLDKFQVTMAGNEIPDFVQIMKVPQYPALLEKYFTDLTDVLGGSSIHDYPALANIPQATWKIPVVNGRLWGITQPRPPAGLVVSTRGDLLAKKGLDPNPIVNNGTEFVELLKALTDKARGEYAMGALPTTWLLGIVLEMMGAPNGWRVQDGKFVSQIGSPEMKDALAECAKIVQAGYLHPNSFSEPASNFTWWQAGTTSLYRQSAMGWGGARTAAHPDWNVGIVRLPKWDGGGHAPLFKSVAGYPDFVAIKKQPSDARLAELLRLADFVASPYGTQQFLDFSYGKLGSTFEMKDGVPVLLDGQSANTVTGWGYVGSNAANILFTAGLPDVTKAQHAYMAEAIPAGVDDASLGLYSETSIGKGATFAKAMADVQRSVMLGEQPLSAWDEFVTTWKSSVGDAIAAEYAEAANR